jgi:hypothetical protein
LNELEPVIYAGQWLYSARDELDINWSKISFALIGCLQGITIGWFDNKL